MTDNNIVELALLNDKASLDLQVSIFTTGGEKYLNTTINQDG